MTENRSSIEFAEYELYEFISSYCTEDEEVKTEPVDLRVRNNGVGAVYVPDLYLPNGCKALGIIAQTIIEVKSYANTDSLQKIRFIHDYFYQQFQDRRLHFLCVFMSDVFNIIGYGNINKYFGILSEDFQVISYKDLREKAPEKALNENRETENERIDSNIMKAKKAYLTEKCSFILGAGVSKDAGIKAWDELLKGLIREAKTQSGLSISENDYKALFEDCGSSSIIMGRFAQTLFGDNEKFKDAVAKVLYEGKQFKPGTLAKKVCQMIKTIQQNTVSVITYNYDDLIEQGLREKQIHCEPVSGSDSHGTFMPVYHVHGYLSQDKTIFSDIVLSEREYHDIYRRSFHWSNVEQLHAMQRSVCFFIGLSMTDPNLRRLLDIAQGELPDDSLRDIRHFAFIEKNKAAEGLEGGKADEFRKKMEEMLKGLGVVVIWFDGYNALPPILDRIME